MDIVLCTLRKYFSVIHYDLSVMRINIIIVLYIILMVRRRHEQRIKVNHLDSKILQIVQLIHDSLQISAIKVPDIHGCRSLTPILNFFTWSSDINIFIIFYVICRISVIETVYKNLIHDCPFCPFRCGKSRLDNKGIVLFCPVGHTIPAEIADLCSFLDLKIIAERLSSQLIFDLIKIKFTRRLHFP